jgi:hypothetical protein
MTQGVLAAALDGARLDRIAAWTRRCDARSWQQLQPLIK